MDLSCKPHENGIALINWIYLISGSCIYGHMSELSWVLSIISVSGWILAGTYQITLTFRSKRAPGFSPIFLSSWVIGDITNVIGCYFTDQMTFQKVLSTSSLILDGTMLLQYFYYRRFFPEIGEEDENNYDDDDEITSIDYDKGDNLITSSKLKSKSGSTSPPILTMLEQSASSSGSGNRGTSQPSSSLLTKALITSALIARSNAAPLPIATTLTSGEPLFNTHTVGIVCAWICQSLYTFSPLPQILKNFKHRSTGGVSVALFLADMVGNFGYSMSIIAASRSIVDPIARSAFLREERPYLAGTTTTFLLELTLLYQYIYYGTTSPEPQPTSTIYYEGESITSPPASETTLINSPSNKKTIINYSTVSL